MSKSLRVLGVTAFLALSACALVPSQASAMSSAECGAAWKAAKTAGTVPAGMKWPEFQKGGCVVPAAAAAPAAPAAPAAATAVTPSGSMMKNCSATWKTMTDAQQKQFGTFKSYYAAKCPAPAAAAAAPAAPAAAAPAAAGTEMSKKDCSAAWHAAKDAGTIDKNMKLKDYMASGACAAGSAAAPAAPAAPAAAAPAKAPKASLAPPPEPTTDDKTPIATVDKNGKPLSAGRIASIKRERACGLQWRTTKAAGKIPAGLTWPQYWSQCNKDLKAKGQ